MKIFVTGATGFVGSAVVKELVGRGQEVTGLVRRRAMAGHVEEAGAKVLMGNLLDPAAWSQAVKESDLVISASQPVRFGEHLAIPESHRRSYYHGKMVANLFLAAQDSRVKAIAVTYGALGFGNKGEQWVDGHTDLNPVGYERSVTGAFWHIDKTSRKTKVPLLNVFTGWAYGPGNWCEAMARGVANGTWRMAGPGDNFMSLIHIEDLASAYAQLAEKLPMGERMCLVDGNPVTQKELLGMVAGEVGCLPPKAVEVEEYARASGELAAESISSSVRLSGDRMKKLLLPELKYPSCKEGIPSVIKALGIKKAARRMEDEELKRAAGF